MPRTALEYLREDEEAIFIRLATKKENNSQLEKRKAFNSFDKKDGFEVVYKLYGHKGRGFYYLKKG